MNAEEQGAAEYRALADKLDRQPGPANQIRKAVHRTDVAIADWLDGLAGKLQRDKERYWRGAITTHEWERTLDDSLAEMRKVAELLRTRPINIRVSGI